MTKPYLTNITPDSLSGMIFAFEGIKDTMVLLNGPSGCKFYHSAVSDDQSLRQKEFNPLAYPDLWFFGQPRVPCTYLDKRDYVYGSRDKVVEAITFLQQNFPSQLLVVINSPGAALIGDDLNNILADVSGETPIITVETPGYSKMVWEGYSQMCIRLIDFFKKDEKNGRKHLKKEKKKVNILGLSIFHKYYLGDLKELKRLFQLCDIEVNCALCADSSVDEIMKLGEADLNVVIDRNYGLDSAYKLEELYGTPFLVSSGLPIGFSYVEEFFKKLCHYLDCDDSKFIEESERARALSYIHISRINSLTGLPKGTKFAIHGTISTCLGYTRFLTKYFGMVADSISIVKGKDEKESENPEYLELYQILKKVDMADALEKDLLKTDAEIVFADGNIIAKLKSQKNNFIGVEIGLPTLGYVDVVQKTHLGVSGSLLICEQVLNGLMF